jgi:putative AlgH/UPF0301 family transcriptional regulator
MYHKHKLLVANSKIVDPVFSGKVIFLFEHNEKGAHGVILNSKEVGKVGFGHMKDLFNAAPGSFDEAKDLIINGKLQSVPLFSGGPCNTPGVLFLHAYKELSQESSKESYLQSQEYDLGIPVFEYDSSYKDSYKNEYDSASKLIDGFYFGTPHTFGHLIEAGKLSENKFKFFTGLSSWVAGQLEYEIENEAWTVIEPDADLFFDVEALDKLVESVVGKTKNENSSSNKFPWMPDVPQGFDPSRN